jgi:hypothetical protein
MTKVTSDHATQGDATHGNAEYESPTMQADNDDIDESELSALAKAQLRIDVETKLCNAVRTVNVPNDYEFFDPFEVDAQLLRYEMRSIGRGDEFAELMERAKARFPKVEETGQGDPQFFESRYNSQNDIWLGVKGVFTQAALWLEAKEKLDPAKFEEFAEAVNLRPGSKARAMVERVAQQYTRARSLGSSRFLYWALLAVILLLDDDQFDQLASAYDDLRHMRANELTQFLSERHLQDILRWKAENGGAACVIYEFVPRWQV